MPFISELPPLVSAKGLTLVVHLISIPGGVDMDIAAQINLIKLLKDSSLESLDHFCESLASLSEEKEKIEIAIYSRTSRGSYKKIGSNFLTQIKLPTSIPEEVMLADSILAAYSKNGYATLDSLSGEKNVNLNTTTLIYPVNKDKKFGLFVFGTHLSPNSKDCHFQAILSLAGELLDLWIAQVSPNGTHSPVGNLTLRQSKVLELVMSGKSNKEVAWELGVSVPTIKQDLKEVYGAFSVSSRSDLSRTLNRYRTNEYGSMPRSLIGQIEFGDYSSKGEYSASSKK
jgi:DNA-binding CsgD family transcriptional regulator